MKKEVYVCDMCAAIRKDANHWFLGIAPNALGDWISIKHWSDETAQLNSGAKHLCGQACVHKFVDEFLSK